MKNIVICCDGTGNQIEQNLSNVLKVFRIATKNKQQSVFYDPGVGTIGAYDNWGRLRYKARSLFALATGRGVDENVLDAYRYLLRNYQDGDDIFILGFSRGAYTARVLAGFIHLIGLLRPEQENIRAYALAAYKQASEQNSLQGAWHFQRVAAARRVRIKFLGVWDTVSSVIVPRPGYPLGLQKLPYTHTNPSVQVFRHAMAIDERRRMFRLTPWQEPQPYVDNPFDSAAPEVEQDCRQVWFSGVHSDVGGGYPEQESGASKFPLLWMLEQAIEHGLKVNQAMLNHLALGAERPGSSHQYVNPDVAAGLHNSMRGAWPVLEVLPKRVRYREWQMRGSLAGLYLPRSEPRLIKNGARLHWSVLERQRLVPSYEPVNLPTEFDVEGSAPDPA